MAITIAQVLGSRTLQAWDITTTDDADTIVDITSANGYAMFEPDGITSIIPQFVVIQQLSAAARLSDWIWDLGNTNNLQIRVVATNAVGSGDNAVQARVYALAPHSIM